MLNGGLIPAPSWSPGNGVDPVGSRANPGDGGGKDTPPPAALLAAESWWSLLFIVLTGLTGAEEAVGGGERPGNSGPCSSPWGPGSPSNPLPSGDDKFWNSITCKEIAAIICKGFDVDSQLMSPSFGFHVIAQLFQWSIFLVATMSFNVTRSRSMQCVCNVAISKYRLMSPMKRGDKQKPQDQFSESSTDK